MLKFLQILNLETIGMTLIGHSGWRIKRLGRQTCDQAVVGSTPGRAAMK